MIYIIIITKPLFLTHNQSYMYMKSMSVTFNILYIYNIPSRHFLSLFQFVFVGLILILAHFLKS